MKKKRFIKALPISEHAYLELERKYGVPVEALKQMAKDLNVARPRLEMHLIVLQQAKRRGQVQY